MFYIQIGKIEEHHLVDITARASAETTIQNITDLFKTLHKVKHYSALLLFLDGGSPWTFLLCFLSIGLACLLLLTR